ncbi:hypothetical protein FJ970_24475 [Mesorhizobium sp. B2-1-8]|uniref:hypothetical protein n=1 Tax=Mesorhizobium sp. B2-1-8 TaxID=2589967 RepID=UPI001D1233AA|nr:hypothetical protein [Mesorhizobium sp. B2-1-8]UCI22610.1 hypothetical protein FJ970_24475 [Mesorhizobium sp. B2-1-8]
MNVAPTSAGNGALLDTSRLCVCTDRIQETSDVVTLVFERVDGRGFDFRAGQSTTIRFGWNGEQFSRVLNSLATKPPAACRFDDQGRQGRQGNSYPPRSFRRRRDGRDR